MTVESKVYEVSLTKRGRRERTMTLGSHQVLEMPNTLDRRVRRVETGEIG
jgi:hypothetical protein